MRKERDQLKKEVDELKKKEEAAPPQASSLEVTKKAKPFVDLEEFEKVQAQLQRAEKENRALVQD